MRLQSILFIMVSSMACFANLNQQEHPPKTPPSYEELLNRMDENKDGKLSKDEIKGPLKNDFDKFDSNKDNFLTKEEFKNAKPPKPINP